MKYLKTTSYLNKALYFEKQDLFFWLLTCQLLGIYNYWVFGYICCDWASLEEEHDYHSNRIISETLLELHFSQEKFINILCLFQATVEIWSIWKIYIYIIRFPTRLLDFSSHLLVTAETGMCGWTGPLAALMLGQNGRMVDLYYQVTEKWDAVSISAVALGPGAADLHVQRSTRKPQHTQSWRDLGQNQYNKGQRHFSQRRPDSVCLLYCPSKPYNET